MTSFFPALESLPVRISASEVGNGISVLMPEALFKFLVSSALQNVSIDTASYLKDNPDVEKNIKNLDENTLKEHFVTQGYFEGRKFPVAGFDEKFYLEENPDVKRAYSKGLIKNCKEHYLNNGIKEFRSPCEKDKDIAQMWKRVLGDNKA